MKRRVIWLLAFLVSTVFNFFASPLDEAAGAYEKGDYGKAIEIYENISKEKGISAALLANLGNAYVKAGDYGHAMLCYQRALRLNPANSEVKDNIAYLVSKIDDNNKAEAKGKKVSVVAEDKPFFTSVRRYISFANTSNSWALWAGIMFVITCACAAIYIFTSNVLMRKIGFFGGFIALGISLITLIFAFVSYSDRNKDIEGVVMAYKVNLYSEPSSSSKPGANALTRGTLLEIIDEESSDDDSNKWYKVRLNSDYSGWINASDFEVIR
ncbi:MAG: tetratricopeptide repeat protein [Muribaculaceae bacterium]|nr:tetratricopeptide repeat protein [Muribaculaceae bacterium]